MVIPSKIHGLVAPVFTPFDVNGSLNLSEIPKYAEYLNKLKLDGVLVNGTVGEGALMSVVDRKQLAVAWVNALKNSDLNIMVHVGGANLDTAVELAKHAELLKVSSILCLPDLIFRPSNIEELVSYLKTVSAAAPHTPLYYYNYPKLTGVNLDMVKFLKTAYKEIPTLCGIKYTHNNLDEAAQCVQLHDRSFVVFLGCDELIAPAIFMGFDSMIATALNIALPEINEIKKKIFTGDAVGAMKIQNRITDLWVYVKNEVDFICAFKAIISKVVGIQLGQPKKPLKSLTEEEWQKLEAVTKKSGFLSN